MDRRTTANARDGSSARRSLRRAVAIAAAMLVLSLQGAQAAPRIGAPAPDFAVTDTNRKSYRLADLKGGVVVLEWTNNECPFVRKHYESGNMQSLQKYAAANGVTWISVISSAPGKQGSVSAEQANALTQARDAAPSGVVLDPDGKLGRAYDARTTPHLFVIDAKGMLVYMGGIDDKPTADKADIAGAHNYARAALDEVLNGKAVSEPLAMPYGCSVKYD